MDGMMNRMISTSGLRRSLLSVMMLTLPLAASFNARGEGQGGVRLGQTRLVFASGSKAVSLGVRSTAAHPWLVQVRVTDKSGHESPLFVVLPPLFRLDPQSDSQIRVLSTRELSAYPADREGVWYLHVLAVPPSGRVADNAADNAEMKSNVRVGIENIIKLIYRPALLKEPDDGSFRQIDFSVVKEGIQACNRSRYALSFSSLSFDGSVVDLNRQPSMLLPFSCETYRQSAHQVSWSVIDDYGGTSATFRAEVKGADLKAEQPENR